MEIPAAVPDVQGLLHSISQRAHVMVMESCWKGVDVSDSFLCKKKEKWVCCNTEGCVGV